jgi:hypothetical protein
MKEFLRSLRLLLASKRGDSFSYKLKQLVNTAPQLWGRVANHERRLNLLEDRVQELERKKK